ncbi:MAG: hypothetical protein HY675_01110 [Chloroflexi bacterium]|nr:hypothetical protein [Chloroflexota bacterium]
MTESIVTVSIRRSGEAEGIARYKLGYEENMTVLRALERIYMEIDPSLAFRHYCCKIGVCGSCAVKVNGKSAFGCKTTIAPNEEVLIEPVGRRRTIRDLVVDFSTAERSLPERTMGAEEQGAKGKGQGDGAGR